MKVCKKCKKQIANKAKICKYCGADVSKINGTKKKDEVKEVKKEEVVLVNEEEQKEVIKKETPKEKYNRKFVNKNNNSKKKKNNTKTKSSNNDKDLNKKEKNNNKSNVNNKDKNRNKNNKLKNFKKEVSSFLKKVKEKISDFIKSLKTKRVKKETEEKNKEQKEENANNSLDEDVISNEVESKVEEVKVTAVSGNFFKAKNIFLLISFLLIVGVLVTAIVKINNVINNTDNTIVPGKKDQKTVFNIGDVITYKDVDYTLLSVTTSSGTKYKHPKDGNCYVVVTVEYHNRSNEKVRYSYKDWKMGNSTGEDKSRIFAPVNADNALYTGMLVVGGTKTGSMIFEQPIGDEALALKFFEYKEQEEVINSEEKEEQKEEPVFIIKIPKLGDSKENI